MRAGTGAPGAGEPGAGEPADVPAPRMGQPAGDPSAALTVATFNVHAGVDGWGRPFDVVEACRRIDADILMVEEDWVPDGGEGVAAAAGRLLGYEVWAHALAGGRRARPDPAADARWMRSFDWRGASHAIYLDSERPLPPRVLSSPRYRDAERGRWGLALLSRLPLRRRPVIELGRLSRDGATRAALVADVTVGPRRLTVVGTHMSHITYGAPLHYLRLRRGLGAAVRGPAVLVGDMNLWGPPVRLFLTGWHRAGRHKTWPAWRAHSQVDHVLVHGPVRVLEAEALPDAGSDHLPVRVRLVVGD